MAEFLTEFLKLLEIRPEEAGSAFAEFAGGALGDAALDGILQAVWWAYELGGVPPFVEVDGRLNYSLPPLDDWIVAGVPAVLATIGAATKNKSLFRTGLGGIAYGAGMFLHHIILRKLPDVLPGGRAFSVDTAPQHFRVKQSSRIIHVGHKGRYRVTV